MATRKPRPERPDTPKRPKRSGVPLHVYIPPELMQAITGMADDARRKLTQEVIIALEEHAKRAKRWPPPRPAE